MVYLFGHSLLCMRILVEELQYTPCTGTEHLRWVAHWLVKISQKSKEQSTRSNPCCASWLPLMLFGLHRQKQFYVFLSRKYLWYLFFGIYFLEISLVWMQLWYWVKTICNLVENIEWHLHFRTYINIVCIFRANPNPR